MGYYIDTDKAGNEVRTEKKRGRTRKGFVETAPGRWEMSTSDNPLTPINSQESKNYVYARFDDKGEVVDQKEVKRGRPPKGYTKCEVMSCGSLVAATTTVMEAVDCELNDGDATEPGDGSADDDEAEPTKPDES